MCYFIYWHVKLGKVVPFYKSGNMEFFKLSAFSMQNISSNLSTTTRYIVILKNFGQLGDGNLQKKIHYAVFNLLFRNTQVLTYTES